MTARTAKKTPEKSAAPKRLDPFRIVAAEFVAGAGPGSALPAPVRAEIAFVGRSNVGKSSLVNTLVERKSLVRTGATPGVTRQLNLFEARAADGAVFHLVDLPGYGFAKRSKAELAQWATLIEGYLRDRVTLAAVVLIVDVRRGLEDDDRELVDFVASAKHASRRPVEVVIVATKIDKIPKSQRKAALLALEKTSGRRALPFSSITAEGRAELWRALRRAALGSDPSVESGEMAPGPDAATEEPDSDAQND